MNSFASGFKRNYYGKGDVTVYRLNRTGVTPPGKSPVFSASVLMLIYGDAFWPTYTTGDNTGLVATDSMKNFIQREAMNFEGYDLESFCLFLGTKFLTTYSQAEGAQISASEVPYARLPDSKSSFAPAGPERLTARVELARAADGHTLVEARSGVQGFRLLRLGGSAFHGFVRDQYTTLPDIANRPLNMWLDVDWTYIDPRRAFNDGTCAERVRTMTHEVFEKFESGSIQQVIYQLGQRVLQELKDVAEIRLEANNRTWDTVAEVGDQLGVYTDARPPYGCLGLTLKR